MTENLMDGLSKELNRARDVKALYDEIPEGRFGSVMIGQSIQLAERAIKDNDVVAILVAYNDLKEIE